MREITGSLMESVPTDPHAEQLVQSLIDIAGEDQIRTILLFGSRLVQASPDRFSAYDLVLVVENYRAFYEALARAGLSRRPPALQAALNHVLAPNVVAFAPEGWNDGPVAKIMVLEPAVLERALSRHAPDHFLKGRLVQRVALLHSRDGAASDWIVRLVTDAHYEILRWAGPFLEESFTPAEAALGWPSGAPFNGIIVAAAAPRLPRKLIDQLAIGGRLVVPIGIRQQQELMKFIRTAEGFAVESFGSCRFVPLVGEDAWDELDGA